MRRAVRFPIVGIGASAGGLEACTHLLQHLPLDTGMGFVLVQHLDPAHASALTQLLARATQMPVHEVSNNMPVLPNHMFERIHPTDEYEGTGIGLTIVRIAAERMGGQVDFESEPGQGSKFWLELRRSDPS